MLDFIQSVAENIVSDIVTTVIFALMGGASLVPLAFYRDQVSFFELVISVMIMIAFLCLFIVYPVLGIERDSVLIQIFWINLGLFVLERTGWLLRMRKGNVSDGGTDGSQARGGGGSEKTDI